MTELDRKGYYSERARAERQRAAETQDAMIARIHSDLAARYEELAASEDGTMSPAVEQSRTLEAVNLPGGRSDEGC